MTYFLLYTIILIVFEKKMIIKKVVVCKIEMLREFMQVRVKPFLSYEFSLLVFYGLPRYR